MNNPARQAAEEIAALINSRAQSPRIDELEVIIAGVTTRQDASTQVMTPAPAVLEWHRMLAEDDRRWMGRSLSDGEWSAMLDGQCARAKQAFASPVRSWEDVALLGAIAMTYNFLAEGLAEEEVPKPREVRRWQKRAKALAVLSTGAPLNGLSRRGIQAR